MANLRHKRLNTQLGFSLIEAIFALFVMFTAMAGLATMFAVAAGYNSTQGDISTRTAECAQDKMETLMGTSYASLVAGTTGTEYLDINGQLLSSSSGAFYTRTWTIALDTETSSRGKIITVTVSAKGAGLGSSPTTTLRTVKGQS